MSIELENRRQDDLDADIAVFENVSLARARFFDDIVANRGKDCRVGARELRQDTVYQLAEFYYLLDVFDIAGPDGLTRLGHAHNRKIEELCESDDLHEKLGIQPQRLHDAMFDSDEKFARLQANCGANGVRLSQSDLARLPMAGSGSAPTISAPPTSAQPARRISPTGSPGRRRRSSRRRVLQPRNSISP